MKRIILSSLLLVPFAGLAQTTETDSIATSVDLDELVVEGRTQRVVKYGVEYIPGKKVKKAASNATNLLLYMQIPQLNVSPTDYSVTTQSGAGVSIFIDHIPATQQDIMSLQPEDVLRVEVLDYPQDPRFNGAQHVVNFIMRRYEWGGYTKLTASGRTLNDEWVDGNVYEKFSYRNWTFDASASAAWSWTHKYRDYSKETFRDITVDGQEIGELTRTTRTTDSHGKINTQQASLRGAHQGKNSYISHSLSFQRDATPENRRTQAVAFSEDILPSSEAGYGDDSQSISVAATGYYQFFLPKGNYLKANWIFSHTGTRRNSSYRLAELSPVANGNREKVYYPEVSVYYSKSLGHDNSLSAWLTSYASFYDTHYSGSYDGLQKLSSSESMLFMDYAQNWGFGLSLFTRLGVSYVIGRLNGRNILHEWNPRLGLKLQYQINAKNSVGFEGWWNNSCSQPSTANSALVRTDELMWHQGNPDLRNIYGPMLTLSYNLIPSNSLSLFANAIYNRYVNVPIYLYHTIPGHDGMVRTFSDDSNEQQIGVSAGASLRLFNNSLSLYARGSVQHDRSSGIHPLSETYLTGFAQAAYFVNNLSFTLYYVTPSKELVNKSGYVNRYSCGYGLIASYAVGNFNAQFSFRNWFGGGKVHSSYSSAQFDSDGWKWVNGRDRSLSLSLTYTIPYGKKIERREDLENNAHKRSAILE